MIDTLAREKMNQLGKAARNKGSSWIYISVIVAIAVVVVAAGILWFLLGVAGLPTMLISLGSGVALFVIMQLINPALRYRNMFSASGFGVIALALYGSSSFALTVDGNKQGLPFFLDFSTGAETKTLGLAVPFLALLALAFLSAHYDNKIRQNQN